jgi:NAD(P)-dependent dehydrogenase (short-subunit alcohol dehydrogenase family)
MKRLAGRRVIVSGGGQGIGAAIVRPFAAEAAQIAVLDGCAEAAGRLAEEIGGSAYAVDLADVRGTREVMDRAITRLGGLDVLVNNAAITGGMPQEPTKVSAEQVLAVVDTNVVGVIRVTNAMLPLLRRAASPRIVNVSSTVGSLALQTAQAEALGPISAAYSPTKSYLNAITIQYAKELADGPILVNAGCPGFVATDLNGHRGTRTPEQGAAIFLELATLPDDGPSGTFRNDAGILPW